jgi:hypothetical protein
LLRFARNDSLSSSFSLISIFGSFAENDHRADDTCQFSAMVDPVAAAKEPREEDEPWTTSAKNPVI